MPAQVAARRRCSARNPSSPPQQLPLLVPPPSNSLSPRTPPLVHHLICRPPPSSPQAWRIRPWSSRSEGEPRVAPLVATPPPPSRSSPSRRTSPPPGRSSPCKCMMPEIDWNLENTRIICQLLAEQVGKGNRPNTYLNALGYAEVEKGFKDRTGLEVSKSQIKNKWDKLKENFKAWKKLMLRQTGTGWDNVKGTFDMDEEWWKKARVDISGCGKFKKLGLQNEDELTRCFADITSIGNDHWSPHSINVPTPQSVDETQEASNYETQEEAFISQTQEEVPVISPSPASGKRLVQPVQDKGKNPKTGRAQTIQDAVTSMASSAAKYASNRNGAFSIPEVMAAVIACGATVESDEHYIAFELFVKKEQREMFMTMPTNENKFNWLKRKCNDKNAK